MKITFLIGNGFDIGLGLHTQYEDFYPTYCKDNKTDSRNIKEFKEMLLDRNKEEQKKIIDWADFEKAFGEHSKDFDISEKGLYLERFESFVTAFNDYLANEMKTVNLDDTKLIGKTMKDAVTTYFHIREDDKDEITALYKTYPGVREYHFISFNYTRSIDECVRALKDELKNDGNRNVGEMLHVHGYIENNMIMGVNDVSQILNPDFSADDEVVNEIVKPQQNILGKTAYDRKVSAAINTSDVICIYGMSLGDTDKKWWVQIAEWLNQNEKRALVILKHDREYSNRFIFKQQRVVDGTIERFLSFSDWDHERKAKVKKRIYVGGNHDVFAMKLHKQPTSRQDNPSILSAVSPNMQYLSPELLDAYKLTSEINALSPQILDPSLSKIAR